MCGIDVSVRPGKMDADQARPGRDMPTEAAETQKREQEAMVAKNDRAGILTLPSAPEPDIIRKTTGRALLT